MSQNTTDKNIALSNPIADRADEFMMKNQYKKAVGEYLNALLVKQDGSSIREYKGLSKAYKKLKKYDKAIKHLEKAKKVSLFDSEIYYELGLNYLLSADFAAAAKNFIKTIKLEPDNLNAQVQLAITHELMEEPEMAILIYNKIIEQRPDFILAYNHKAGVYMQLDEFEEAAKVFHKILQINNRYYKANLGLGICFDKLGRETLAVRFYKKYIVKKPASSTTKALVGRIVDIYKNKYKTTSKVYPFKVVS